MIAEWEANCVFLAAILKDRHPTIFTALTQTLSAHEIDVRMLDNAKGEWATDYCPIQVGAGKLVKFRYDPDYLKNDPELRTGDGVVISFQEVGRCRRSKIILDGGNVVGSRKKA